VFTAQDGLEARSRAKEHDLDLVITDISMPNEEGLGTIRGMRKAHPSVKIIAISGAFGPDVLRDAKILGAAAALSKPMTKETVLQCVHHLSRVRPAEKPAEKVAVPDVLEGIRSALGESHPISPVSPRERANWD
jgi:two-component system response regulator YesN